MNRGMAREAGVDVGYEEVNFVGEFPNSQPRNDPYSNSYNPYWRNHPNFSWQDPTSSNPPRPIGYQPRPPFQPINQAQPQLLLFQQNQPQPLLQ